MYEIRTYVLQPDEPQKDAPVLAARRRGGAGRVRPGHGGLRGASRTLRVVRRRDDGPDDQGDIAGREEGEGRGFKGLKEFFTIHYSLVRRAKGVKLRGRDFKCVEPELQGLTS